MHAILLNIVLASWAPHWPVSTAGDDASDGVITGTAVGSCDGGHGYILDVNGIQGCYLTSDIAPGVLEIHPEDNYSDGTQAPAVLAVRGGIDEKKITIDNYLNCEDDTVDIYVMAKTGTVTKTTRTESELGGNDWNAVTSNAVTATNLAAAIDSLAGVSATASSAKVLIAPDSTTLGVAVYSTSNCLTEAVGADAAVVTSSYLIIQQPFEGAHAGGGADSGQRPGARFLEIRPGGTYTAPYSFNLSSWDNTGGDQSENNQQLVYGYNCRTGATLSTYQDVAGEQSWCDVVESNYSDAPASHVLEQHWVYTNAAGTPYRYMTNSIDLDSVNIRLAFDAQDFAIGPINAANVVVHPVVVNNQSYANLLVDNQTGATMVGTNPVMAGVFVKEPKLTDPGAPSCTVGAGVYIQDEPTECGTNNALHVATGKAFFGGAVLADSVALSVPASANYARLKAGNTNAITIPDGTTSAYVTALEAQEPNITLGAGAACTVGASLFVKAAPTECGFNAAVYVENGATVIDGTTTLRSSLSVAPGADNVMDIDSDKQLELDSAVTLAWSQDGNAQGTKDLQIARSGAGIVKLASTNNTNNEDLSVSMETTANTVSLTSSTGVTSMQFGAIARARTAATLTLANLATTFALTRELQQIDGSLVPGSITSITGCIAGVEYTLRFVDTAITLVDNNGNLNLNGNFVSTANDELRLDCIDGTILREISRSAN